MNSWSSKEIGDGVDAFHPTMKIQEAFLAAFVASGQPKDMAVFSGYDRELNMITVYFSPSAGALGKAFDASPCEIPSRLDELSLIAGPADSWKVHFPEKKSARNTLN